MHASLVKCVQNLVGKVGSKRLFEGRKPRCEDNIKVVD
jgi:hypothetical protein